MKGFIARHPAPKTLPVRVSKQQSQPRWVAGPLMGFLTAVNNVSNAGLAFASREKFPQSRRNMRKLHEAVCERERIKRSVTEGYY